jgi:hypothetical protein
MQQLAQGGFVASDGLTLKALGHALVIEGDVVINDHVYIRVWKQLSIMAGDGADATVQTTAYSYNAVLKEVGTIFRYNSPHEDHNQEHHVHRFDVLGGSGTEQIDFIYDEEQRPTLREVIDEAYEWYCTHEHQLPS